MPSYDYKKLECSEPNCNVYIEIFHDINQKIEHVKCEDCGKETKISKVFSSTPVHFKGSGFYVNDYRKSDDGMKKYLPRDPNQKRVY
jgi:predicted nucleic acid-binding Zn ribbon protein